MSGARTLVVHPPLSIARDFIDYPWFTDLGAVQVAAALRAAGHDVRLVDAFALPGSGLTRGAGGRSWLGASAEQTLSAIGAADEDLVVVAITPFHRPPRRDEPLAAVLEGLRRRRGGPVLLADLYQSGQHYVQAGPELLDAYPEADAWLRWEAERSLLDLLAGGDAPRGVIDGAAPDLTTLPFPAWDLVDLDALDAFRARVVSGLGRGRWAFPIDGRTLPLVTSRGCPFSCAHCSSNPDVAPGAPKTQRRYPPARLRRYLSELVRDHGATRLAVLDELINVHEAHFDAFLEEVVALDVAFEVPNGYRADYLLPRHLSRMRGRTTTVSVSAESGSQRVLDEIVGKRLERAAVTRAAEASHRAAVPMLVHFIIGLPGETAEEINETLDYALDLWDRFGARPAVQFATPLPGTRLAAGRALPVVDDWGPRFQKAPSQPDALVSAEDLQRFRWTLEQRLRNGRGPRKLIMNVTYVCNNHCTFCAVGTRTQIDGHPPRQREHLAKYRRHGIEMVDFDGGEPTLNPELVPLIRYARALGYTRVNVTTNGRLCAYEEYAQRLVTSGLTTLLFSVHGPDLATHARLVGVAEAFEQTLAGIRHCVRHRPAGVELGMNITLTKQNFRKLPQVAELAWELELRWLNVQFLTPFGRATRQAAPDTQEAADVTMAVIDAWKDRMKIQVINLPFCFMPGYERHVAGDLQKLGRHMVFVNNETVNLADYLAERRVREPVCASCPHACFCGGFYQLDDAPEPQWLVTADALVRRLPPDLDAR